MIGDDFFFFRGWTFRGIGHRKPCPKRCRKDPKSASRRFPTLPDDLGLLYPLHRNIVSLCIGIFTGNYILLGPPRPKRAKLVNITSIDMVCDS